jgi:hypothetical protein
MGLVRNRAKRHSSRVATRRGDRLTPWAKKAQKVLNHPLSSAQLSAVKAAHHHGMNRPGKDGKRRAQVGNYTTAQLLGKARILKRAGFSRAQRRRLIQSGAVGIYEYDIKVPAVYMRISERSAWKLANRVASNLGVEFTNIQIIRSGFLGDTFRVTIDAPQRAAAYLAAEKWKKGALWRGF